MFLLRYFVPLLLVICSSVKVYGGKSDDANAGVLFAEDLFVKNYRPTLANGFLGFTVFSDSVYRVSDVSRRVRLPNYANIILEPCAPDSFQQNDRCSYRFDIRKGVFEVTFAGDGFTIRQQIFPHRVFTGAVVNHFVVERQKSGSEVRVPLVRQPGEPSAQIAGVEKSRSRGETYTVESGKVVGCGEAVSYAYSEVPQFIGLEGLEFHKQFYFFMVVGENETGVRNEWEVMARVEDILVAKHVSAWEDFWGDFNIFVEGRDDLQDRIASTIYYLASNMPAKGSSAWERPFHGLTPGGIGTQGTSTKSSVLWDMEMYMHPPLLLMNPEWSEKILDYRFQRHVDDAESNGWFYPWESSSSSDCSSNNTENLKRLGHVGADVAFATRNHFAATGNVTWMKEKGCLLAYKTAKFWSNQVKFNQNTTFYDLIGRWGRDNIPWTVNNAFFNTIVGYNFYFGEFAKCFCRQSLNITGSGLDWIEIARSLVLPYDTEKDYYPQYEGYTQYMMSAQADTVLLSYPLQYPMDEKTKRNTLQHYRSLTLKSSPPTTWAMQLISDLELKETRESESLFAHLVLQYMEGPFYVWVQRLGADPGVKNFISGAGAFLQVLMNGYGGIRLRFDRLEITNPQLPPWTDRMKIQGISYLQSRFDLTITAENFTLEVRKIDPKVQLRLIDHKSNEVMRNITEKHSITRSLDTRLSIESEDNLRPSVGVCRMPTNRIGINRASQAALHRDQRATASKVLAASIGMAFVAVLCAALFILYRRYGTILPLQSIRYVRSQ